MWMQRAGPELFEMWAVFQWSMYKVHELKLFSGWSNSFYTSGSMSYCSASAIESAPGLYVFAYRCHLTQVGGLPCAVYVVKWSECVKMSFLCRFNFPSVSNWYCIVRWHIFFYTYRFKCICCVEIRLKKWMLTLWCINCCEVLSMCVQAWITNASGKTEPCLHDRGWKMSSFSLCLNLFSFTHRKALSDMNKSRTYSVHITLKKWGGNIYISISLKLTSRRTQILV